MKFLFACYGKAGIDCLYHLLNQKEASAGDILALTYNDPGNKPLLEHLDAMNIRYTTEPIGEKRTMDIISNFSPDYMFSIYFRDIVEDEVLRKVKAASINLHPSLLPDYKGCFSAPWVLINGERKTGITYHIMEESVDTGNVILQKELMISPDDTAFSLFHRLVALGVENFSAMFQLVVREGYRGIPQDPGGRRYKRGVPYNGFVDLEWGREKIHNFIRAMYFPPYEGAKLEFGYEVVEFKSPEEFDRFCAKRGIKLK